MSVRIISPNEAVEQMIREAACIDAIGGMWYHDTDITVSCSGTIRITWK